MDEKAGDNENDIDIEDLEHRLYAQIHHDSVNPTNESSADIPTFIIDTNSANHSTEFTTRRKSSNRYWNSNTPTQTKPFVHREKQHFKDRNSQSGGNATGKDSTLDRMNLASKSNATVDTDLTPKQFKPYISLLSATTTPTVPIDTPECSSTSAEQNTMDKIENKMNKNKNSTPTTITMSQQINPFSRSNTIEQFKKQFVISKSEKATEFKNKKRLNPFCTLSQERNLPKSKIAKKNTSSAEKRKAMNQEVIDLDENDNDDDVIILPAEKPPLICVDSSDDESRKNDTSMECEFAEPNAVQKHTKVTSVRCESPSSSIQSSDDFVVQTDRRSFGFENLVTLSDEDLYEVGETMDNAMLRKPTNSNEVAEVIFTPPKKIQNDKTQKGKEKTYEVSENSFAAVDVYESESSDMPDSIYNKGNGQKRKIASNSDSDSVASVTINRSKKLRRRKRSSEVSLHQSDHVDSDDSSLGIPENFEPNENDGENENSYIMRGEALIKGKKIDSKKPVALNNLERNLDNDFINRLSSIVHGDISEENDENVNECETSNESIDARDIVESVLQRRSKNSSLLTNDKRNENKKLTKIHLIESTKLTPVDARAGGSKDCSSTLNDSTEKIVDTKHLNSATNEVSNFEFDAEAGWNDEMKSFYNDSWGGELFSVRNIQFRMPKPCMHWGIISKDSFPTPGYGRNRSVKCSNCQEKGHLYKSCPKPINHKRCHMCGSEGHIASNCPQRMCLYCGRQTKKFARGCSGCDKDRVAQCYVCKRSGHKQMFCPDRWRRYHSTITAELPLVTDNKPPPNKKRFCSICALEGHTADTCNNIRRYMNKIPISFMNVMSYRPIYQTEKKNVEKHPIKCTILASSLDNYTFNFGSDVTSSEDRIYGRFLRSVKLPTNEHQTKNIIEVMDSEDFSVAENKAEHVDADEIVEISLDESIDESINNSNDEDSFEFDSTENFDETLNSIESKSSTTTESENTPAYNAHNELEMLDRQMKNLDDLKQKILLRNRPEQSKNAEPISSETHAILPDFIPLHTNKPENYQPVRSPTPETTAEEIDEKECDATIYLTEDHCNSLVAKSGREFLTKSESNFNVSIRMEWKKVGNVLLIHGFPRDQAKFHEALITFFAMKPSVSCLTNSAPKKREALINYIREHIIQLDGAICDPEQMPDVVTLYKQIRKIDKISTKSFAKKVDRLRRQLNMILFGRFGFSEGKIHLDALQKYLRRLRASTATNISNEFRMKIMKHLNYIFSGVEHKNYEDVIEQYAELKRQNKLPSLALDRKLLGLKVNVFSGTSVNVTMKNSLSDSSISPSENVQNKNHSNGMSSSIDIQINVSTPSRQRSSKSQSGEGASD